MNAVIITFSLCALSLAPYAVWASRWNIPAHMSLALAVAAYVVPGLLTDTIRDFAPDTVDLYAEILLIGTLAFALGCAIGAVLKQPPAGRIFFFTARRTFGWWEKEVSKRSKLISLYGIFGLVISFAIMGFVPLFADDPFSAKFFRGEYKDAYQKVAALFRSAHFATAMMVLILLALWWDSKRKTYLWLAGAAVTILAMSLTRAPAAMGMILWLGIWVANRPRYFKAYLLSLVFIYSFGAATVKLLIAYLAGNDFDLSVWDAIAQGAPDIADQLNFLEIFQRREEYTYGRTIYGGLIPGNYKWNPGVWTLSLISDTEDVSTIVSGGLRLPAPLWGYVNFGWLGVISFGCITGFLTARATLYLRRYLQSPCMTHSAIVLTIHASIWSFFISFYKLSFYTVFQILLVYALAGVWGRLRRPKSRSKAAAAAAAAAQFVPPAGRRA